MNFRIFTLLFFLLLSLSILDAQKLRDDPIKIKYVELPKRMLPTDHTTYSVNVRGPLFAQSGSSTGTVAKQIVMDGFKKVAGTGSNGGHLRLEIFGGEASYGRPSPKTRTVSKKDKEGNVTKSYYYYYEVPARCNTNFRIINPKGEIIYRGEYSNDEILKTKETTSTKARSDNSTEYIRDASNDHAIASSRSLVTNAKSGLKLYDYDHAEDRYNMYLIRKHDSADQWDKHYEKVRTVFKEAKYATASSELKDRLSASIAFYEQHASKNPRGDKKLKRIYKAANYNLALLHYSIDEFEISREYADKVIKSENKDRRSRLLKERMDKWEVKMAKAEISSIHYERDLSNAIPPAEMAALEAEKEELLENSTTSAGSVFKGDTEIKGTWSLDKSADDLVFGDGGNIKFVVETGTGMEDLDLSDHDISEFKVADRNFMKMRFVPSAKGGTEASIEILEEVYSSDKIKLYKFYPSSGGLSDDKPEFAYQKKGQEYPISLESTMFLLWKKGLEKYFSDCPDLAEMASEGGVEKTKDSLIKAARVYSELCDQVIKP